MDKILELIQGIGLQIKESGDSFIAISEETKKKISSNINLIRVAQNEVDRLNSSIQDELNKHLVELASAKKDLLNTKLQKENIVKVSEDKLEFLEERLHSKGEAYKEINEVFEKVKKDYDSLLLRKSYIEDELNELIDELNEVKELLKK